MVKVFSAELFGTMVLVLFGCGAAVLGPAPFDQLAVALAFGFAIVAMAYGIGPISGCHVNPAVSLGVFVAGRMRAREIPVYWIAQVSGALLGAFLLSLIARTGAANGGQSGWGVGVPGDDSMHAALIFETVATAIFVGVILGVTGPRGEAPFAGIAIGVTLAAIHIVGIQVTGVSVNPAHIVGPAVLVGGQAVSQAWLFIAAPLIGAAVGGLLFRLRVLDPDA